MDTSKLKAFAPQCRNRLIEQVGVKLDYVLSTRTPDLAAQEVLVKSLQKAIDLEGREQVIERVAYSWFNRLAALRYLDAHGWHPFRLRVITPVSENETQPELLKQVRQGVIPDELKDFVSAERVNDLLDGKLSSDNPQAEVQRLLVIGVCQYYAFLLPDLFERIDDFSQLLLPDDLLTEHSVVHGFRTEISDEDCAEVEVLGWLYQFYISEKKDEVMARKKAVPSEDIPYVTQLFTPNWIVRYMVENSLGRLWLANRPDSSLVEHMPYFIPAEEEEVEFLTIKRPEEIKIIDPAVGSGHILSYAFDLLYLIYEEEGYLPAEIPGLILTHNLHGIDLCPRAAQLAELSLLFKARQKSRQFFTTDKLVRPHIIALQDICFEDDELREYMEALDIGELFTEAVLKQLHQFCEATTFGSLLQPILDQASLSDLRQHILSKELGSELFLKATHDKVLQVIDQAEMLLQRYHCVIANPPYMGGKGMSAAVKEFAKMNYSDAKADLFAMFIDRGFTLSIPKGYNAMVTMQSWMFLSSFEKFRNNLITQRTIVSMAHLGARGFDSIGGEVVQTTAFVTCNEANENYPGAYFRLIEGRSEQEKSQIFLDTIAEIKASQTA